ncbi:MAG TPA: hypothetical protein VIO94_08695 [Phenylobacterium sp.]
MAKWAVILLVVMVLAAIVGFLVDAVRIIAGILFVLALIGLVAGWFGKKLGGRS